jgi:hypothetical protein
MSKKPSNTHFVSHDKRQGDWTVKRAGSDRASSRHETKAEAVDAGREVSRNQGTELKVKNMDGKISQSDSHGHDPHPPRG